MKHNHALNLARLLQALKDSTSVGGITLQQLVDICGVSKRQVYRYLRELEQMGIEIERPRVRAGRKKSTGCYRLNPYQVEDFLTETMLLMFFNELIINYQQYKKQVLFLKEFIIHFLAMRHGLIYQNGETTSFGDIT
ncbi:helix-turn-helix, type 11 domain-containing protein [Desulfotomaculum nigrificans CO-1-SRB]|uniref:Helix-turn-helix, type 11 domain-containing protein n=1 Tax=Desulfotomaculum nigrificans (strain DSM 14880 / VKM B-2319 / CO-1-SRB) TaxID=868595 RepID=F6B3L2_DESCC|nr:HTH domain-containing protein [Desulfotomaculum nigrificans]AEF94041.1 helix-turn-helix, type 11 domain-containing protein [Desulfotomaculum nigrificans CO-1-SRB]